MYELLSTNEFTYVRSNINRLAKYRKIYLWSAIGLDSKEDVILDIKDIFVNGKEMAGSIHEGPEFGVGDFVLLHDLTLDAFMENLKMR